MFFNTSHPTPLHDTGGIPIADVLWPDGALFIGDDGQLVGTWAATLFEAITPYPYRVCLLRQLPTPLGGIWICGEDYPIPPITILLDLAEATACGLGVLLLARRELTLERTLHVIGGVLAVTGVAYRVHPLPASEGGG
jgi:hypothetical protein